MKPESPNETIHVVSPEMFHLEQRMKDLALQYPFVVSTVPLILSKLDFVAGMLYIDLAIDFATNIASCVILFPARTEVLLQTAFSALPRVLLSLLRRDGCKVWRSESDEAKLKDAHYRVLFELCKIHIMFFSLHCKSENDQTAACIVSIKQWKAELAACPNHYRSIKDLLAKVGEGCPKLRAHFYPNQKQGAVPMRKESQKIVSMRSVSYWEKWIEETKLLPMFDSCFEARYPVLTSGVLTRLLKLHTLKNSDTEFVSDVRELVGEYLKFEAEGEDCRALCVRSAAKTDTLSALIDLYAFFGYRFDTPSRTVLQLLGSVVMMFVFAQDFAGAALRVDVLKFLLQSRCLLDDKLILFCAKIHALNGCCDDLAMIYCQRRQVRHLSMEQVRQKRAEKIKHDLELKKTALNNELKFSKEDTFVKQEMPSSNAGAWIDWNDRESSDDDFIASPRVKVKTRPNPVPDLPGPNHVEDELCDPSEAILKGQRMFSLSKSAYDTFKKIQIGDWKFSRDKLMHLFEQLGCRISSASGKGDHARISLSNDIIVENDLGLVTVFPSFGTSDTSLTLCNWDGKWDGRVPPYLAKAIRNALILIGATEKFVHKKGKSH